MSTKIKLENLLTPDQAAQQLGLSAETVRQYARDPAGRLTAIRIFGRLAFTRAEIERYRRLEGTVSRIPGRKSGKSSRS